MPGCMTTIEQFLALVCLTRCLQACSASYWMLDWMVSRRFRAATGCLRSVSVPAIGMPLTPVSTSSLPSRPASSELYSCSRPAWPVRSPVEVFSLVKPTRLEARLPLGYRRA